MLVAVASVPLAVAVASVAVEATETVAVEDAAEFTSDEDAAETASVVEDVVEVASVVAAVVASEVAVAATEVAPALSGEDVEPSLATTVHCFTSITCGAPLESVAGVRVIIQVWVMPFSLKGEISSQTLLDSSSLDGHAPSCGGHRLRPREILSPNDTRLNAFIEAMGKRIHRRPTEEGVYNEKEEGTTQHLYGPRECQSKAGLKE